MNSQKHDLTYSMSQLLRALVAQQGSDLHITSLSPPRLRIHGVLLPLDLPALNGSQTTQLCHSVLNTEQKAHLEQHKEIDLSFAIRGLCRFRANIFYQRGQLSGVFRVIPATIPSFAELGLPAYIEDLCQIPRGLVLVTGPTGSGKSTTLAAMIDFINARFQKHIVTIEDPIEYVHSNKVSLISQRELGSDTHDFAKALKSCLRQDPDVVLVGELRDLESISLAISTAETGHLVFATLHTNSCVSSLNRMIDAFPAEQQAQIRVQLSLNLMGVLSQLLVPTLDGKRAACIESMVPNAAIRNLIRDNKVHQIYSAMQVGQEASQMRTMNQALADLILNHKISQEEGLAVSSEPTELMEILTKTPGRPHPTPRNHRR